MNSESLDQVVKSLRKRISALENHYKNFVKYCIEMIKCHRLMVDSELKNDPNTPRELLFQISQHGEALENRVKLASDSIPLPPPFKISNLETFKSEFRLLLSHDLTTMEQFSIIFSNFESFIRENYITKDEIRRGSRKRTDSPGKRLEILQIKEKKFEEIEKLVLKVSELNIQLVKKEEKIQRVYGQLEKIQKMQANSMKNIEEHCFSLNQSKILNFSDSLGHRSLLTPDMHSSSSMKAEDSFDSKYFYSVICKKLVGLAEIIKKFTQQAWFFHGSKGQSPEFDLVLQNFRMDTEEIEKVIEDIVTPRFKEDLSDRGKESTELLSLIKKLKAENFNLSEELKSKDQKILAFANKNSAMGGEIKSLKVKLQGFILNINDLQLKNYEITKENSNLLEKIKVFEDKNNFLSVQRVNSGITEKSAEVFSVMIERNYEIVHCGELSVRNVYRNENLIRELRKMLKAKEKECLDKENLIKDMQKEVIAEQSAMKPEFLAIKNKFSPQDNYNLNKKLSQVLIEKANIEEKFQESESLSRKLALENDQLATKLPKIESELKNLQILKQNLKLACNITLVSQFEIHSSSNSSIKSLKKSLKLAEQKYQNELSQSKSHQDSLTSKISELILEAQKLQTQLKASEQEQENQKKNFIELNRKSLLKENQIELLNIDKERLSCLLEENKKNFHFRLLKIKAFCENQISEVKIQIGDLFKSIENSVSQKLVNYSKSSKKIQNSFMKLKLLYQNSISANKFLTMRIEDKENSINTLTNSLKLAESTIQSYGTEKRDIEKESLLARISALNDEISLLSSQKKSENFSKKNQENNISEVNQNLQNKIQSLVSECGKLEEKLRLANESSIKDKELYSKNLDSMAKQLAGASYTIEELKSKLKFQENWKNEKYEIVKCVSFSKVNWFLIHLIDDNLYFWTDQRVKTELKDEFEELKLKYAKIKNYCYRIREEYKKLKRRFDILKKNWEADKGCWQDKEEVLEITSPFVSPRDLEIHQICDGLRSARSCGTEFEEDTFGELSSKIIKEGNSIFNASSFEDLNEDTDKLNQLLEKMNSELQIKNELIKNYEKTINELKISRD